MQKDVLAAFLVTAIVVCCVNSVIAQEDCPLGIPGEIFCDDFSDGNATDGLPGTWLPGASPNGTRDASSGDFVATHSAGMSTFVEELNGVRDVSIRTQVNLSNENGNDIASVWARSPLTPDIENPAAYVGGITADGLLWMSYFNSERVSTVLNSMDTSIDPVGSDVSLQFDVFGSELSLTAWQEGVDKIQITATDTNLTEGGQVGFSFTSRGGTDSATFRYYQVVPEPSSTILSCLGLLSLLAWRRKKPLA